MNFRPKLVCAGAFLAFAVTPVFAQAPVGELFSSDASVRGSVLLAGSGTQVLSGSQVSAGATTALLKLTRGGTVRICPNTSLAVATSPNGRSLLYSLNSGSMELHYDIGSEADALQTPDFRMQLIGPGKFDLNICSDNRGGLALRGKSSTSAVIVNEMMGDGVYQVPAGTSIDFNGGSVKNAVVGAGESCGCPVSEPSKPVTQLAEQKPPEPPQPTPAVEQPVPETHVQIDAPFVFNGDDPDPNVIYTIANLETKKQHDLEMRLEPTVVPPAPDVDAKTHTIASLTPPPELAKRAAKPVKKLARSKPKKAKREKVIVAQKQTPPPVTAPPPEPVKVARVQTPPPPASQQPAKKEETNLFKKIGSFFGKLFGS